LIEVFGWVLEELDLCSQLKYIRSIQS